MERHNTEERITQTITEILHKGTHWINIYWPYLTMQDNEWTLLFPFYHTHLTLFTYPLMGFPRPISFLGSCYHDDTQRWRGPSYHDDDDYTLFPLFYLFWWWFGPLLMALSFLVTLYLLERACHPHDGIVPSWQTLNLLLMMRAHPFGGFMAPSPLTMPCPSLRALHLGWDISVDDDVWLLLELT